MSDLAGADDVPFSPDESVHVHEEGAIRLICAQFRSHEDGLPEWIKNSSDMYRRMDAGPEESVILVLLRDGGKSEPSLVGCLDFGGMTTADIEQKFRNWADPDAAGTTTAGIEGGHGNGGKCYMTQMFASHAYIHTVRDGRGNKYGFKGGNVKPGYFPSAEEGRGYPVDDPDVELTRALQPFGLRIASLPEGAKALWEQRKSFTLVLGVGAKTLTDNRIPYSRWVENLQGHQQMVQSIQRNRIFAAHYDGRKATGSEEPLALPEIRPIPGAEAPRVLEIPAELVDSTTRELVPTEAVEGTSQLVLRTSDKSMRWSLKARHTINGWTHDKRSTGYWEIPSLSRAGYANQIYGDLYLDRLADFRQNDRRNHSDAPLTRALRDWISEQIEAYSAEFVKLDQLHATKEERAELSRLNDALNAWKNKFLEKEFGGIGQGGAGGSGGGKPKPRLPRGEPARLVLTLHHTQAGQGVTFRPSLEFFDAAGSRIRAVPYEWESSDWAVATVDGELNMITTHTPGRTTISAVCKDSGVRSNGVELEVLNIRDVALSPAEIEMGAGSRQPITATVHTKDGRRLQGVYLIWTEDNSEVVSVGSGGMVFGLTPGTTTVTAGDNQAMAATPTRITVLEADEKRKDGGTGFPRILLSEIDDDPLGEEPPVFSQAEPPVHQRPQDVDHNIWWINMASPLARRYFDAAKGGAKSREWRVYHLERYIEIMVKIILYYDFMSGEDVSFETMLRRWEEESITMQQNAIETLQEFLGGGELQQQDAA